LTKVEKLEARVDKIAHTGNWDDNLTTAEANSVRAFWIQLHWTSAEAEEYAAAERRQDEIRVAAGSVYFNTEQNREYNALATRQVELIHDIRGKRVGANRAMSDRVWPEFVPRALRYWKLVDKPREQLTDVEAEEFKGLLEWFSKLQAEALEAAKAVAT
jgi:hypothetical protein